MNNTCFNQSFVKTAYAALLPCTQKRFALDIVLNVAFLYIANESNKLIFSNHLDN